MLVTIRRALLSVSDKTGLVDFARALSRRNVEILSTGGTARTVANSAPTMSHHSSTHGRP
jgi:phosphoribosylaminoimidazolecarboxamide formyltransferase/IMP cyclohydrolase